MERALTILRISRYPSSGPESEDHCLGVIADPSRDARDLLSFELKIQGRAWLVFPG
jgi:hypothetical protein